MKQYSKLVETLRSLAGEPHRFDGHNEIGVAMLQAADALEAQPAPQAQPVKQEPLPNSYQVLKDGNSWVAVKSDFKNLQESPAAYGDSPVEALGTLIAEQGETL